MYVDRKDYPNNIKIGKLCHCHPPPIILGSTTADAILSKSDNSSHNNSHDQCGNTTAALSSQRKPVNRSAGSWVRAATATQPDSTLEIVVGEWRRCATTPRNAVIARLDARGRLNFRVVARTMAGDPVAGTTATATSYNDIILAGTNAGMTYPSLRTLLIRQLSGHQQPGR